MAGLPRAVVHAAALAVVACGARTDLGDRGTADASPIDGRCTTIDVTLQVSSLEPWTDTGLDVVAGQTLAIHASGTVRYGGQSNQLTDANGGNFDGQQFFSTAVLPSAVVCSVIGKIGGTTALDTGAALPETTPGKGAGFVGVAYQGAAPSAGRLFLGFNDQRQAFGDNAGAFTVTVHLGC